MYKVDPKKLAPLVKLREDALKRAKDKGQEELAAELTQAGVAQFFGLERYDSVGAWESGKSVPPELRHRSRYIIFLLDKLGLRHDQDQLFQLWNDIMVEAWKWERLTDDELSKYFPGIVRPTATVEATVATSQPKVATPSEDREKPEKIAPFPTYFSALPLWGWISIAVCTLLIVGGAVFFIARIGLIEPTQDDGVLIEEELQALQPISPIFSSILSPTTVVSPSIKQILVGQSQGDYKLQITAFNSLDEDLLVTGVKIEHIVTRKPDPNDIACRAVEPPIFEPPVNYDILGDIVVIGAGNNELMFKPEISPGGELSGYTYSGQGTVFEGCIDQSVNPRRQYKLELSFETSFLLPKNDYTDFFIKVPKQFNLQNVTLEDENLEPVPLKYSWDEPGQSENFEEYAIFLELSTTFSYPISYTHNLLP